MKKAFWIVLLLLIASVAVNVWQWQNKPEPSVVVDRDTVWKDTTIREPLPAETINTGRVVYVKVPIESAQTRRDTITLHDSIEVPVPIYQKRYDDSLYTAWVSGFEPNLDSIRLYIPEITTTITKTIVKKAPRLSFGIQAGAGFGIIKRQPDIFIGVGGTYRILP